jgi:hypothetical protein
MTTSFRSEPLSLLWKDRSCCEGLSEIHRCQGSRRQCYRELQLRSNSYGVKKLGSNPPAPASDQGCVDPIGASAELHLNASALSSPHSLILLLTSDLVPSTLIQTLVDSGSTHCFLDSAFTSVHKLRTTPIPPMLLRLFDGSCSVRRYRSSEMEFGVY